PTQPGAGPHPHSVPSESPTQPGADPHPHPPVPSESPTHQMPTRGQQQHHQEEPTTRIPGPPPSPPGYPSGSADYRTVPSADSPAGSQATTTPMPTRHRPTRFLRDPLALTLVAITAVALVLAGLIGAELYARHLADDKVAKATECVVHDQASVSFGVSPPFLWQHITGNYTNISIQTAGNQIKDAKEMQADLSISDVRLHSNGDSSGTIGALDATLTWPSEGIKETIQSMVPLLGNLVSDVTTNAADGTVELKGAFGLAGATVKPQVVNGGLSLQVQSLTGLGSMTLPREAVQPALDDFASALTKKYPLGIHADSVQVTDSGVVAHFSTRNATIPSHSQDPCFAHL
ncbi:MAG: LmeA family phospholipid-binding protein, partial [Mycobacterium sp.]